MSHLPEGHRGKKQIESDNSMYRTEKDSLGEKQIPADALYGIHAVRAKENFPGEYHNSQLNGIKLSV